MQNNHAKSVIATKLTRLPDPIEGHSAHFRTILDNVRKPEQKITPVDNNTKSASSHQPQDSSSMHDDDNDNKTTPTNNKWTSATRIRTPLANRLPAAAPSSSSISVQRHFENNINNNDHVGDDFVNHTTSLTTPEPRPNTNIHRTKQGTKRTIQLEDVSSFVNSFVPLSTSSLSAAAVSSPTATLMSNVFRANALKMEDTSELKSRRVSDPSSSNNKNIQQNNSSFSCSMPPWIPTQVEETLLFLRKELSAISVLEIPDRHDGNNNNNNQTQPSFDSIRVCLEALNRLSEITTTPVFKPVLDLISSTIARETQRSQNAIDILANSNEQTAQIVNLKKKLEETTCAHFTDLLQERKRTKEADGKIGQVKEQFAAVEKEWREKVLDAESDKRVAQLQLAEIVGEIDELREDRNALMSVRKAQEAHVREVEEKAAKVVEDAERQVGMMKEELESKNRSIKELTTQMKYDADSAKKEFEEYASKALPPVKSAALRAEADRYKLEVKKLKERVEKLVAELQRREAFEPAVPWEEFVDEDMLIKLCNATGIPFIRKEDRKKSTLLQGRNSNENGNNVKGENEEYSEEDEAQALLLATRSAKFSQQLFRVWQSTESVLTRYEAEKETFRTLAQIFFFDVPGVTNYGIPLDRLHALTSADSTAAQFMAHQLLAAPPSGNSNNNNNAKHNNIHNCKQRLHLECPPIDSSSPEPWVDPAWVGCFVQGPKQNTNFNNNQGSSSPSFDQDFFSDLDVPVVCNAEHAFKMVKVVIPPCLMTLSQVKSICVSALVLLGLNRVPDRYDGWHPSRHFAHAIKLQLEAAIEDVRNLSSNPNLANLPPQAAFYAANNNGNNNNNSADAFFEASASNLFHMSTMFSAVPTNISKDETAGGIPYDPAQQAKIYSEIQNHLRRRFVIDEETWAQIDHKATIAGCMTVLYNRLQEFSTSDPFMKLCHSFFLGTRPVLLHARYFALTLRSATQFFSRIEKMLRGTALGGSLPAPLFVQALKPAFGINDSTDISRLSLAAFHTHYWIQMQENRKSQMDIICPGHDYVETEEERAERKQKEEDEEWERKKKKSAKLKKRQQDKLQKQQGDDNNNHVVSENDSDDDEDDQEKQKGFSSPAASLALAKAKTVSILDQVLNAVNNATKKSTQQLAKEKENINILPQYKAIEAWLGNNFHEHHHQQQQQGEFSYKKCFGTCWSRSGHGDGNGASPLLLQYCTIYANDVLYCEKIVEDDCILNFSRATLVTRWNLNDVEGAVKRWMSHFRKWKDQTLHSSQYYLQLLINQQQAETNADAVLLDTKNNGKNSKNKNNTNAKQGKNVVKTETVELLEEKMLMQTVASLQQTASYANLDEDDEDQQQQQNSLERMASKANFFGNSKNNIGGGGHPVISVADIDMPFANSAATSRVFPFVASGIFDPSDAFHFDTICQHPPVRAAVSFEDVLGVPIHGPEPKLSSATRDGPALLSALQAAVGVASQSGHNVSTHELVRNILQSHPWHPSLLLRVAAGSWFLAENISSNPDLMVSSVVGLQEMANTEMMNAMNKVLTSGPEIIGKKGKKKK